MILIVNSSLSFERNSWEVGLISLEPELSFKIIYSKGHQLSMNSYKYFIPKAHSHLSRLKFGNISNYVCITFFFFSFHDILSKLTRKGLFNFIWRGVCVSVCACLEERVHPTKIFGNVPDFGLFYQNISVYHLSTSKRWWEKRWGRKFILIFTSFSA